MAELPFHSGELECQAWVVGPKQIKLCSLNFPLLNFVKWSRNSNESRREIQGKGIFLNILQDKKKMRGNLRRF